MKVRMRNNVTLNTSRILKLLFRQCEFDSSKDSWGKQYKSLASRTPSTRTFLEAWDLIPHLSGRNWKITLLSLENLETNSIFVVIEGTCKTLVMTNLWFGKSLEWIWVDPIDFIARVWKFPTQTLLDPK